MERKYYLRGLGVGIVVTAIIMGIALSGDQTMTDDEIIARAGELGMVENTVLADDGDAGEESAGIQDEPDPADAASQNGKEKPAPADGEDTGTSVPEPAEDHADGAAVSEDNNDAEASASAEDNHDTETPTSARDGGDAQDASAVKDNEETQVPENAEDNDRTDTSGTPNEIITSAAVKTITVNHGDGSYTVAKKLEDVGVVTSAATFDTFLCQNGYDKRLRTGTFSIPADASDEQIARIVTGAE